MSTVALPSPGSLVNDPRWLAAGAGGLISAALAMWAFRGLPLGPALLWLSPMPLFLVGFGFGLPSLLGAVVVSALGLALLGGTIPVAVFAVAFAIPAILVVATGLRQGRFAASVPLALLGVYPALCILGAEALLADSGGLEAVLTALVKVGIDRMGMDASETLVADIVPVMAAAVGFWLSVAMLVNGLGAQRFLVRRGLALVPNPGLATTRLPLAYPALPAIALGAALLDGFGGTTLSLLIILLMPMLLRGLGVIHTRSRGRKGGGLMLGAMYVALAIFSLPTAIFLVGLALFDHFAARPARGTT